MEGRWARLTLSAHYDGALDFSDITWTDLESIFREQLIIKEASRRLNVDYLKIQAAAIGNIPGPKDVKKDLLLEIIEQAQDNQYPWIRADRPRREAQTMENYEKQYAEVTAAFKEHWAKMKAKEREAKSKANGK